MRVLVDGVSVGAVEVKATSFADYAFPLAAAVRASARIDVVFDNDGMSGGQDRNLYVESLTVNGSTMRPTDRGVTIDLGSGSAAFDGVNVIPGQTGILWNAALRFTVPADPAPKLIVRAKASLAGGVGARMQARVDGVVVGTTEVKATSFSDFAFALAAPVKAGARIDVVFDNDGASGGEDRNLYVEAVIVNGKIMRPTDAGAVVDLGSGSAAFDGINIIPGRTDILWDAALRLQVPSTSSTTVATTTPSGTTAPTSTTAATTTTGGTGATSTAPSGTTTATGSAGTTTTAPSPTPTAANAVDITSFGAVCNGTFNNSSAIANAIASAKSKGVAVFIPAGVCAYGDVITLDGVKMQGSGDASVLYALNWQREAIFMRGSGSAVTNLKLSGVKAPSRQAAWEMTRITLFGATNFLIDRVTIDGSAAAGIQTAQSTNNGRITNSTIKDTLADSIHMTDRASYITLENNRIENAGDDGIAVVSYRENGGLVNHITARNNTIVNSKWGRQMSVVGGSNVLYENNHLENNLGLHACLYIAQESSYSTYGAHDVIARQNTLKNCGGASSGHGAVMVYSDGQEANTNISLIRNDVQQNGQSGIRIFSAMNTGITVDSNRVQGANPALDITSPGVLVIPYSSGAVGYVAP